LTKAGAAGNPTYTGAILNCNGASRNVTVECVGDRWTMAVNFANGFNVSNCPATHSTDYQVVLLTLLSCVPFHLLKRGIPVCAGPDGDGVDGGWCNGTVDAEITE
jgi:hypothetical protein